MKTLLSKSLLVLLGLTSACGIIPNSFAMIKIEKDENLKQELSKEEISDKINEATKKVTEAKQKADSEIKKLSQEIEKILKTYDELFSKVRNNNNQDYIESLKQKLTFTKNGFELVNAGIDLLKDDEKKDQKERTWLNKTEDFTEKGLMITQGANKFGEKIGDNEVVKGYGNSFLGGMLKAYYWVKDTWYRTSTGHFSYHGPFYFAKTCDNKLLAGVYYTKQNINARHIISQTHGYLAFLTDKAEKDYAKFDFNTFENVQQFNSEFCFPILKFLRHDALKALVDGQLSKKELFGIIDFLKSLGTVDLKLDDKCNQESQDYRLNDISFPDDQTKLLELLKLLTVRIDAWMEYSTKISNEVNKKVNEGMKDLIVNKKDSKDSKDLNKQIEELNKIISLDNIKEALEPKNKEIENENIENIEEEVTPLVVQTTTLGEITKDISDAEEYYKQQRKLRDEKEVKKEENINKNLLNNNNNQQVFENQVVENKEKIINKEKEIEIIKDVKQDEKIEENKKIKEVKKVDELKK